MTTKGAKRKPAAETLGDVVDMDALDRAGNAASELVALEAEANDNARALAEQLGYAGALTAPAVTDEIRFYQRRTVEDCLELGKRFLLLRELTPHGEFVGRLEGLGVNARTAQRFMSATLKFGKNDKLSLLNAAGNPSKLLELVTLDDEEIADLAAGGSARGITLDKVEAMSTTELRKALREAQADAEAKDRVLADKSKKVDELAQQLARPFKPKKDSPARTAEEMAQYEELQRRVNATYAELQGLFVVADDIYQAQPSKSLEAATNGALDFICQRVAEITEQLHLPVNFKEMVVPSWLDPADVDAAVARRDASVKG